MGNDDDHEVTDSSATRDNWSFDYYKCNPLNLTGWQHQINLIYTTVSTQRFQVETQQLTRWGDEKWRDLQCRCCSHPINHMCILFLRADLLSAVLAHWRVTSTNLQPLTAFALHKQQQVRLHTHMLYSPPEPYSCLSTQTCLCSSVRFGFVRCIQNFLTELVPFNFGAVMIFVAEWSLFPWLNQWPNRVRWRNPR